jgi:hypothetical protein
VPRKPLTMAKVKPIRIAGGMSGRLGTKAGGVIQLQLDQKAVDRAKRKLDKYRGKALDVRMQKGVIAAADALVTPIRAAAPVGKTGKLRASTKARQGRRGTAYIRAVAQMGGTRAAIVGPRAPHKHLVIRGHRIVTRSGVFTGRRTIGNPYVKNVERRHLATALRIMREHIMRTGA